MKNINKTLSPIGIISPHAGYDSSGIIASESYSRVKLNHIVELN